MRHTFKYALDVLNGFYPNLFIHCWSSIRALHLQINGYKQIPLVKLKLCVKNGIGEI
jgi:hypothetical protein